MKTELISQNDIRYIVIPRAAGVTADQALAKLAASLERHAVEVTELQAKLTTCEKKGHELELELTGSPRQKTKADAVSKSKN